MDNKVKITEAPITSETHNSITANIDKWRYSQLDQPKQQKISLERSDSLDNLIAKKKPEWDGFIRSFISSPGRKGIFIDLDGTLSHFSGQGERIIVLLDATRAMKQIMDKGHLFAIVTGRPISYVVQLFKEAGASDEDIQRMEISGEYGAVSQGPSTNGEHKEREDLIPYSPIGKEILDTIEARIKENDTLKDKVKISRKLVGGTIHNKGLRESLEARIQQGEKVDLEETIKSVNTKTNSLILDVLKGKEEYKYFYKEDTKITGINLLLNENTTGIEVSKGTAVDTLVKMGELEHALAMGDDHPDLVMQKRLQELATIHKISEKKFEVLQLRDQAFLGVRHINPERMPTPPEIENASTAVVSGPDQVVKVLSYIAKNIKPYDVKH